MARIYLSATYSDLKACRDAVYRILRMLRHDVISMEDYVATDAYPLHKCLADVASSEVYVGLVGWRYGYIPDKDNPERKSITELEYRQAGESGLPRLLFLVDNAATWPDDFRDAKTGEVDNGQRIALFRAELEQEKLVSYFRTADHLAGLVSVAVQKQLEESAPPRTRSRVQQIKCAALEQRLNALLEDYQAVTQQLAYTLSVVDQNRLKRHIEALEQEMEQLENQLEGKPSSSSREYDPESKKPSKSSQEPRLRAADADSASANHRPSGAAFDAQITEFEVFMCGLKPNTHNVMVIGLP